MCRQGWGGDYCDELQCNNGLGCLGNGVCDQGVCRCFVGYVGPQCAQVAAATNSGGGDPVPSAGGHEGEEEEERGGEGEVDR